MEFFTMPCTCTLMEGSLRYNVEIEKPEDNVVILCNAVFTRGAGSKFQKCGFKEVAKYRGESGIVHVMLYIPPERRLRKKKRSAK